MGATPRPPSDFWADTQFWAPEMHSHRGRFCLFGTVASSTTGVRGLAILVADRATGPFVPWSEGPVTPPELPCLDGVEPPEHLNLAKDPLFTDGAFLLRSPAGRLLMLWSSFGEEGYAMGVAVSESGSVLGPWTQNREPLWPRNGGHGMVFTPADGAARLVFHWPNETPHERVTMVGVRFDGDELHLARGHGSV
ncbi:hypothetical protein [Galbitalea soli]|uniref:Family 43 glycosylhydrolase n=1 Tax=Galbitalea soli TaxID=1268042 RepID=A0A7C9TSP7_9MICO|nr:hypothetical protein [Galbitalea soli]NEM91964.1 hypothetical protein [Galbitalea soli]NYJ32086.1 hypothetical protein [Galbitalea soli]